MFDCVYPSDTNMLLSKAFIREFTAAASCVYKWGTTNNRDAYTGFRDYVIYTRCRVNNPTIDFKHVKLVNIIDINYDDLERSITPDMSWLTIKGSNFNIIDVLKILTDLGMSIDVASTHVMLFAKIVTSVIFVDAVYKYPLINFPVYARGTLKSYLSHMHLPYSDSGNWKMYVYVLTHRIKYNDVLNSLIHCIMKRNVMFLDAKKEDIDLDDICPICYDIREDMCHLSCCKKFICQSCIYKILKKANKCPMCRYGFGHDEIPCIREVCIDRMQYIKQKYPYILNLNNYIQEHPGVKQYVTE